MITMELTHSPLHLCAANETTEKHSWMSSMKSYGDAFFYFCSDLQLENFDDFPGMQDNIMEMAKLFRSATRVRKDKICICALRQFMKDFFKKEYPSFRGFGPEDLIEIFCDEQQDSVSLLH